MVTTPPIHSAIGSEIAAFDLHELLRLRSEVFIVEQECVYDDIDGLDILPTTRHLWMTHERDSIIATLRILTDLSEEAGPTRIGRVATHVGHRGNGLAGTLLGHALEMIDGPSALSAQTYLEQWYGGFGFVTTGPEFIEDGIPHIPMRRPAP